MGLRQTRLGMMIMLARVEDNIRIRIEEENIEMEGILISQPFPVICQYILRKQVAGDMILLKKLLRTQIARLYNIHKYFNAQ